MALQGCYCLRLQEQDKDFSLFILQQLQETYFLRSGSNYLVFTCTVQVNVKL